MDFSILEINEWCAENKIDLWGIAPFPNKQQFDKLYLDNLPDSLNYLKKDVWENPKSYLPWARSVIIAAFPYNSTRENSNEITKKGKVWISRYAFGEDYHKVLRKKLKPLKDILIKNGYNAKICVDSFPILERSLALKAGLGFIGKNGLLINPAFGSFLFLAEIVTDLEMNQSFAPKSFKKDFCKNCQKCVSACPTKALMGDGRVNPSKCISSYNVEWKGALPEKTPSFFGNLFGCDICQEVCPFNKNAPLSKEIAFRPQEGLFAPSISDLLKHNEKEIYEMIKKTPLKRRGASQIIENLKKIISDAQTKSEDTELSS